MGISPITGIVIPRWISLWFGVYPTWQGIGLQIGVIVFIAGGYLLAEKLKRRRSRIIQPQPEVNPV
jgi:high-affinity iron transporter